MTIIQKSTGLLKLAISRGALLKQWLPVLQISFCQKHPSTLQMHHHGAQRASKQYTCVCKSIFIGMFAATRSTKPACARQPRPSTGKPRRSVFCESVAQADTQ